MTTSFEDFRNINKTDKTAQDKIAADFIDHGSMATTIIVDNTELPVGFVYSSNPELPDTAHLFTKLESPLPIGTVFSWIYGGLTRHYLIVDETPSVKKVLYHEYNVYECNTLAVPVYGYLLNTASKYIDTKVQSNIAEISTAKPLLVVGEDNFDVGDIITLYAKSYIYDSVHKIVLDADNHPVNSSDGRIWRILEKDDYSTEGIIYYSLESFVAREKPDNSTLIETNSVKYDEEVRAGTQLAITTENGYFNCDTKVITQITPNVVYVTVPYTASYLNIASQVNGQVINTMYKVVM